jgi:hypothetical protein
LSDCSNDDRGVGVETEEVQLERWRRTLLVAAAGAAALWTHRLVADSQPIWTALLWLLPWTVPPLVPLLVPRRDFALCCVVLGSAVVAVELLLAGLFLLFYVPSGVVVVLVGVAGRAPVLKWVALAVVLLDLSGVAAWSLYVLLSFLVG